MATAPTLVTAVASVYNTGAIAAKTVSLPCQAGDFLVVRALGEDGSRLFANPPTNDGAALSWTSRGNVGTAGSSTRCAAWTAVVDTTRTIVVSVAPTDASTTLWWGIIGKVWRGSDGFDAAASSTTGFSTAVSQAITTLSPNCALDFGVGDYSGGDRSNTANYLTSAGAVAEDAYFNSSVHYTINEAHHGDVGAAGAKAVGRNESYPWSMVVVAVKGTTAVAGVRPPLDPQIAWTDDFGPGDDFGPNPFTEDVVPLSPVAAGPVTQTLTLLAVAGSNASMVRQPGKVLLAVPGSAAVVVRQAGKVLLATSAGGAVVARVLATGKTIAAVSASSVVLVRQPGKVLSVASAGVASLVRMPGKVLAVASASSAVVARQPGKVLAAVAGSSASVASINARGLILSAVAGSTATVSAVRTRVLTLVAAAAASVVLSRSVSKTVLAVEVSSATVAAVPPGGTTAAKGQLPTLGAG